MPLSTVVKWVLAIPALLVLAYIVFVLILLIPFVQRHALYVHKLNTLFWHDISRPEIFGFAPNQIRQLTIPTTDHEHLYAWHVLPFDLYSTHRAALTSAPPHSPLALKLLQSDPQARVVIYFHGNAGHVANSWRTDTYRSFASLPHTHVLTIDYRGFGRSTGTPSEAGLITDAISTIRLVMGAWGVPPSRIALVGHSLGTAVACAATLFFADPASAFLPLLADVPSRPVRFAGTLLVAPFTSLPSLLLTYKAGGVVPLLAPLRPFPFLHARLDRLARSPWRSAQRLAAYFAGADGGVAPDASSGKGMVHVVHALDDADISFRQSVALWELLAGRGVEWGAGEDGKVRPVRMEEEDIAGRRLVVEFVGAGGHDRVCTYAEVNLAVREMLGV